MSTTQRRTTTKANSTQSATATTKPKLQFKRQLDVNTTREYKLVKPSGATFLLQQRGITVYDKERNSVREIRYCPNEPSVYRDEQSESAIRKSIVFTEGRLFVPPTQPNLMAFLDVHPENIANGGTLFELVNKEKNSEKEIEKEFLMHDAISLIREKEVDELLSVALAYGVNVDRPIAEIKHDLMYHAKKSPATFIGSFDNPVIEIKSKIKQAIKYQIIKVDNDGVKWFDTNKLIITVPVGRDAIEVFGKYCLTEEGSNVSEEIDRQLS